MKTAKWEKEVEQAKAQLEPLEPSQAVASVQQMLSEVTRTAPPPFLECLTPDEREESFRYFFFAGYLHGYTHQEGNCAPHVLANRVAEVTTALKSLRTYAEFRAARNKHVEEKLHAP